MIAPLPDNESDRLAALRRYGILDTESEQLYDDLVNLASAICGTPISLISLIDPNRQWFKAKCGLDADETSRDIAFCSHAILQEEVFVVEDTLGDKRFAENPLVTGEPKIRFYAGAPLLTPDNYAIGTLCVIDREPRQITEEQKAALQTLSRQVCANLELRLKNAKLAELCDRKNRFFSILSHDLRSPLASSKQILQKIEEDIETMPESEREEWFTYLRNCLDTTSKLAQNLLDMSHFERGTMKFEPTVLDPELIITECVDLLKGASESKSIDLLSTFESGLYAFADKTMFTSVIQNLLSNALKFTPEGGTISIETSSDKTFLCIKVTDTGPGIKPRILQTIFDIDKCYSQEGTNGEKGSGLGLSLCKSFAQKNGGDLVVQSELGRGATVEFTSPLSQEPTPQ